MRIDTDKRIVNLGECVVDYDELKTVQMRDIIYKKEKLFSEGEILLHEKFVGIIEGKIIRFLYDKEGAPERVINFIRKSGNYYSTNLKSQMKLSRDWMDSSRGRITHKFYELLVQEIIDRDGKAALPSIPYGDYWREDKWDEGDLLEQFYNQYSNYYHIGGEKFYLVDDLQEAYALLTSVLPENRSATEKRLMAEQAQRDEEEKEQRQKAVNADFEKKHGSIPKLKAELIEWAHSDPGIYEANQKYNECEKARKQVLQNQPINEIKNRYSDYDNNYNYYDYNAFLERGRKIAERRKKENEERELQKVLQETAKAPYLEFYSNALIGIKLYFHEVYDFYHGIEDERYRLPDDWDVQKALNYLCDAPTYPIARMKFYGAPSTREVDETIAEKRKTALQKYIQSMRMLFAQKGDFRDGEIPEQKKELVDWRDRKEPFQLALKKYFGYKENFEYVERVVSNAKREEIKEAFADYLEFYQNAKVFISDYLNEINRKKDARKEIPQEDLDRALMYFYNTDSPEEAREAVKEKKYRESRQYGEKGEEEVEYALKWLVGDYIKLEKDASGKYGTKAIVLNNKDFVDEPQEFDHIVIGPQGVFNIETKNYTGKIIIDRDGNWIREQSDGRKVGERNPLQQSRRHEAVLRSIVGDDVPIISVLVIANPKAIIQGAENSKVKLLKSDVLEEYISNYKGAVSYTKEKIQALADEIEKYRVSK